MPTSKAQKTSITITCVKNPHLRGKKKQKPDIFIHLQADCVCKKNMEDKSHQLKSGITKENRNVFLTIGKRKGCSEVTFYSIKWRMNQNGKEYEH